jgi:DNA-directed RNA polymerase subunit RPC12/RpoP
MDITCGDCGARFRLDRALLKDSNAARIRCRKCGGRIVVRLHEESPVPVLPPQETIPPSAVEPAAPAHEPAAFEADISGVVRSEPVPPPPEEKAVLPDNASIEPEPEPAAPLAASGLPSPVPHTAPAGEPEPAQPGTIYSRVEDLFAFPPVDDAAPDTVPPEEHPAEEHPAGENPAEEMAATESERKAPSRRAPSMLAVLVISVLWILLLAGGVLYFGTTKSGHDMLGTLFAGWGSGRTGGVAETRYDIRNVKWSIEKETTSGTLFVVQGEVANVGKGPSGGIGIQAILLGKDNQALAEKTAFAGNLLDNASLGRMDRTAVEAAMSNRFGEGNVNKEIPPGKALPFMVLFFDPPVEIDAVMVKAIDAR